jgi:hypothetical protein
MSVEQILLDHDKYLSDIYGIEYTYGDSNQGWWDPSALFCDNVVFWCLIHWIVGTKPQADIGTYISLIRCLFAEYLEIAQFKVSYITYGQCKKGKNIFSPEMEKKKRKELDRKSITPGYISVKVSFENVIFGDLLHILKSVVKKLARSFVVMHDMDISMDLARISTRAIIRDYLFGLGLEKSSIVNDRHSVGDNCISWYSSVTVKNTVIQLRAKVYNKFVQMVESSEIRSKLGSKLSYLVANTDLDLAEKIQRYKKEGMTRLELTFYCSKLYKEKHYQEVLESYLTLLSDCPTYKVSYRKQWKMIVERLTQMLVVYIPASNTFTYCHWWNSLTGRFQGLQKSKVSLSEVKVLMANLAFNDRPLHYLEVVINGKEYSVTDYVKYRRVEGSVQITIVPGPGNSLYPFRRDLKTKALKFADVGMAKYMNLTLEWPESRINRKDRQTAMEKLEEWYATTDATTNNSSLLHVVNQVVMSKYQPDYKLMKEGTKYKVTGYGYGDFRGKGYLCLTLEDHSGDVYVRCTCLTLQQLRPTNINAGKVFYIQVERLKVIKGKHDLECKILQ